MKKFFGRESYLEKLSALWRKSTSSFVVVAGRRRIGKSTLVEEFADRSKCDFIELVGLAPDEQMDMKGIGFASHGWKLAAELEKAA